jgi:hypothetical protein
MEKYGIGCVRKFTIVNEFALMNWTSTFQYPVWHGKLEIKEEKTRLAQAKDGQ